MSKIDISVIICTYNSSFEKLKSTVVSVLSQKDIKFEIILADDGSGEEFYDKVVELFKKLSFKDYRIIQQEANVGTVKNYYSGLCHAKGEYTYGLAPGDMLYDSHVLKNIHDFAKEKDAQVCFGNVVYYNIEDDDLNIIENQVNAPCRPWYFDENYSIDRIKQEFFIGNFICGVSFLRKTSIAKKYVGEIVGISKYVEDNTTTALMLLDGIRVYHYDDFVTWYEYGTGVSTSKEEKWNRLLKKDFDACYELMLCKFPNDEFVRHVVGSILISGRLKKILYLLLHCPKYLIQKIQRKFSKVSIGYKKPYDKSILLSYLNEGRKL